MNKKSRKFVVHAFATVLLGTALLPAFAQEQPVLDPPGKRFDLSGYTLQLPIAKRDSIEEIRGKQLNEYASPYFFLNADNGAMVFYCTSGGATTRGSHYPRTELRDNNEWEFTGQHVLSATLAVDQQPSTGNLIVGQIHGTHGNTEALKIRWSKGNIVVGVKRNTSATEERFTLLKGIPLHERFSYIISQSDHVVNVTVNGASMSFEYDSTWNGEKVYFKAGNYLQDNASPESAGRVEFFALKRT
ncbi:polysaccharide lyase family 7 protein [Collimonas sp. NPDC087041]|uniref:polysaccharide lyase family 7 protein n=1 Tax=Collimonas sp. NPDC087041 TaxID=3363960 RepID=UPI00381472E5